MSHHGEKVTLARRIAPTCDILLFCGCGGSPMPDQKLLSLAMEARERAEEALTLAETFRDAEARRIMREVAENYEKLAEKLELHARDIREV
jgi:hypothetical protein